MSNLRKPLPIEAFKINVRNKFGNVLPNPNFAYQFSRLIIYHQQLY